MGSLVAQVNEDGTLQTQTTSGDSLSSSTKSSNNTVDSDTFLTLLVAEMQNQDPLEPTSNTEWVAQYAQFTQVETMNEMSESMDLLRANSLVGKDVIMKVTSASTGDVTYASGTVDYIEVENGKPILVIGGNQYSLSDLDSVISDEYSESYDLYTEFKTNINSLPDVKYADKSYADKITSLYDQYNFEMSDYQKNFMTTYASEELDTLANWVSALSKLGVEFKKEQTTETTTSLDDILESFNTKMNAIMDKIDGLSAQVEAQASSSNNSSADTSNDDTSDVTDEAINQIVTDTTVTSTDAKEATEAGAIDTEVINEEASEATEAGAINTEVINEEASETTESEVIEEMAEAEVEQV